jgi:hypothetical protein
MSRGGIPTIVANEAKLIVIYHSQFASKTSLRQKPASWLIGDSQTSAQ